MSKIIKDQENFFDRNAYIDRPILSESYFYDELNKEQVDGMLWLGGCEKILDYGCGTGVSIDLFSKCNNIKRYKIFGVDISKVAIDLCKKKFPEHSFFHIQKGNIDEIPDETMDGAYIMHVLHHARDHEQIFRNIFKKLRPGGKLLINDLTSNNPFIYCSRNIFSYMPNNIKNKFNDDLNIDGCIPEKYKVSIPLLMSTLNKIGYEIIKIEYAHLFYFLFSWLERFIPITKYKTIKIIIDYCLKCEHVLIKKLGFWRFCEVISIQAIKKKSI